MTHLEFARLITLAFFLVAPGATVKVEPYCCELPPHVDGGKTAVLVIGLGGNSWLVAYDPELIGKGLKRWWEETAFHEACHVGLKAFGESPSEIKEAEKVVKACAKKWMLWLDEKRGVK